MPNFEMPNLDSVLDAFHTEKCKRAFLKESSSNPRRMLAGFFLKKVVFSFSESGLFFSFSLFFCADLL